MRVFLAMYGPGDFVSDQAQQFAEENTLFFLSFPACKEQARRQHPRAQQHVYPELAHNLLKEYLAQVIKAGIDVLVYLPGRGQDERLAFLRRCRMAGAKEVHVILFKDPAEHYKKFIPEDDEGFAEVHLLDVNAA